MVMYALVLLALILSASLAFLFVRYRWVLLSNPLVILAGLIHIGLIFAVFYALLDITLTTDKAHVFNEDFYCEQDSLGRYFQYVYFSFITISTIGYGDFSPVHILARLLVLVESTMGICVVAALAGSIFYKLTVMSSKIYIDSLTFIVIDNNNLRLSCSLAGGDISIESFHLSLYWLNAPGGLVEVLDGKESKIMFRRTIQYDIPVKHLPSHSTMTKHSKRYILHYAVTAMSNSYDSTIYIDEELMDEIVKKLEDLSSTQLPDQQEMKWEINLSRSDSKSKLPASALGSEV